MVFFPGYGCPRSPGGKQATRVRSVGGQGEAEAGEGGRRAHGGAAGGRRGGQPRGRPGCGEEAWRDERSLWPKLQEGEGIRRGSRGNEVWRVQCASVLKMLQAPRAGRKCSGLQGMLEGPQPQPQWCQGNDQGRGHKGLFKVLTQNTQGLVSGFGNDWSRFCHRDNCSLKARLEQSPSLVLPASGTQRYPR